MNFDSVPIEKLSIKPTGKKKNLKCCYLYTCNGSCSDDSSGDGGGHDTGGFSGEIGDLPQLAWRQLASL